MPTLFFRPKLVVVGDREPLDSKLSLDDERLRDRSDGTFDNHRHVAQCV